MLPWYFQFSWKDLSHSIFSLYIFALFIEESLIISPCYSLKLCIQLCISLPFSPAFCISSLSICKASSDNYFAFLHFFFLGWFWSPPPVQCYKPLSIVLQALYQILSLEFWGIQTGELKGKTLVLSVCFKLLYPYFNLLHIFNFSVSC